MTSMVDIEAGSEEPLYNIGAVSRMTLVTMATLRAWERRYNFPETRRTSGGHRLYSERDILRLRWVKNRTDEGMQTAQAIHALRHQEETGQTILTEEALETGYSTGVESQRFLEQLDRNDRRSYLGTIRSRLVEALANRNIQSSDEIIGEALALFSLEALILDVIRPVLADIGSLWEEGKIGVATEHLGTNYLRQRLLMWMVSGPPARSQRAIILACAPEEWHEGSLLIIGALLRRRQWPVIYLGQSVPVSDLVNFIQDTHPALVVLVAMTEKSATNLSELAKRKPEAITKDRPLVGFGGLAFVEQPELRSKVPGIYLGSTLEEGILTIEKLLR